MFCILNHQLVNPCKKEKKEIFCVNKLVDGKLQARKVPTIERRKFWWAQIPVP